MLSVHNKSEGTLNTIESSTNGHNNLFSCIVYCLGYVKKIEIMKMISYNVLQKRSISQKYKEKFSRQIRLVFDTDFFKIKVLYFNFHKPPKYF